MIYFHGVTNKMLSRETNYIVMWPCGYCHVRYGHVTNV